MIVIGIDPGQHGAIAAVDGSRVSLLTDLPTAGGSLDYSRLAAVLDAYLPVAEALVVERPQPRPGIPAASLLPLAEQLGAARMLAATSCVRVETPTASAWKRALRVPAKKDAARAIALQLFPGAAEQLARVRDHGRAEALLLAEYGRRLLLG